MGLDMSLTRHRHLPIDRQAEVLNQTFAEFFECDAEDVISVHLRVGQWRKANAIHGWFVRNVQNNVDNCGTYQVSRQQLQQLYYLTRDILSNWDYLSKREIAEMLPPTSGFFFGSTEIDEYYKRDLEDTVKILEPLVDDRNDFDVSGWFDVFEYDSSW